MLLSTPLIRRRRNGSGNGLRVSSSNLSFLASAQPYTVTGSIKISVADSRSAGGTYGITIAVSSGAITLSGITGLSFSVGDGTADATMTFTGSLANINAALDGLSINSAATGAQTLTTTFSHAATSRTTTNVAAVIVGVLVANSVAPVITSNGTNEVGDILTVTNNGTWSGTPAPTYTYQWQRDGVNISGATSSSYTTVLADDTNGIRCIVTGTNPFNAVSANSNAITIGEVPWVRASSGYYKNAAGTLINFLPNNERTGDNGSLTEAASANLIPGRSQKFKQLASTNYVWGNNNCTVVDDNQTAPDGTTTASTLTVTTGGAFSGYVQRTNDLSLNGGKVTCSVFVNTAQSTATHVSFDLFQATDYGCVFSLADNSYVGTGGQTATSSRGAEVYGDGWVRFWFTVNSMAASTYYWIILPGSGNNFTSVTGKTLVLWGAQVEYGDLTSYIPVKQLQQWSEKYDESPEWTVEHGVVTADAAISPDGTMNAMKYTELTTTANHEIYNTGLPDGQMETAIVHCFSVYAKEAERRYVGIHFTWSDGLEQNAYTLQFYDLQGITVGSSYNGSTPKVEKVSAGIEDVGNGWRRIWLTARGIGGSSMTTCGFHTLATADPGALVNGYGSPNPHTGVLGYGVYWWGAQLEQASSPTPYWRVDATRNARAADNP